MKENNPIVYAQCLVLEITRRCNMNCAHCIRGNAQNCDIDPAYLVQAAKDIYPAYVCFSGGEPSLNVAAINTYLRAAEKYGTFPDAFFIATNGQNMANQTKLAQCILRWYPKFRDQDVCEVDISRDPFHSRDVDVLENNPITALRCFNECGHVQPDILTYEKWIIRDGRAADNGLGSRPPYTLATNLDDIVDVAWSRDKRIEVADLYISATGFVTDNCDASFARYDEEHICHINDLRQTVFDYLAD